MGRPTSNVQLRPDLAGTMEQIDLDADRQGFIGLKIMPGFEVAMSGGVFGRIPLAQLLKTSATNRGPRGEYPRDGFEWDTLSYACQEHGHESPVDDRLKKTYREYFEAETVAARRARDRVLRNHEIRVASALYDTTVYTGTLATAAGTAWSTSATADPIAKVNDAVQAIYDRTGVWPNAIVMSRKAFRACRMTAKVIDAITSAGAGSAAKQGDINPQLLAQVFDLKYCFVAGGAKNTANEKQTATIASLFDNTYASVLRVAETNDIAEPCWGRTFHWSEDGSMLGGAIETYREDGIRGDVVRCRMDTHEKVIYPEMAQLITGVLS